MIFSKNEWKPCIPGFLGPFSSCWRPVCVCVCAYACWHNSDRENFWKRKDYCCFSVSIIFSFQITVGSIFCFLSHFHFYSLYGLTPESGTVKFICVYEPSTEVWKLHNSLPTVYSPAEEVKYNFDSSFLFSQSSTRSGWLPVGQWRKFEGPRLPKLCTNPLIRGVQF